MNIDTIENGIWIRVRDLEKAKRFYRDVFSLNAPELETPEFCVYQAGNSNGVLVLEKTTASYLENTNSPCSILLRVADISYVEKRLEEYGRDIFKNVFSFGKTAIHRASDPEDNVILICVDA